ncbi:uncharacterized protein LOC129594352 [Paramacrobiotus metropolitanus]|uniref:uncharacterized protein LOC129594352 n=1 Tax=Paramacrobiotus metropolitanus TaxID=2943436 RepID=UPI0024464CBF|nr:uncharacterized protein LOC129594352 [Paramacrobiotus metropolitanus]
MNLKSDTFAMTHSALKPPSCFKVFQRSKRSQMILTVILLILVIFQLLYGILSVPRSYEAEPVVENYKVEINFPWKYIPDFFSGANKTDEKLSEGEKVTQPPKKYKITACAMMHNEVAYLLEWIEFHRLQGVDHFVLYNYYGSDKSGYTSKLYENLGLKDFVEILPASLDDQDVNRTEGLSDYYVSKDLSMVDCYTHQKDSEWLLMLDVGHFVYSTHYENINAMLLDQRGQQTSKDGDFVGGFSHSEPFSAVRIPTVRFGTSGATTKFKTSLSPNSYTNNSVDILYEPYGTSSNIYPMVMEINTRRAPHRELDANYTDLPVCSEAQENAINLALCSDSSTVTLVRSDRQCVSENMTECLKPTKHFIWPELTVLRADNHEWRSREHFQKSLYGDFSKNQTLEVLDSSWFSLIQDDYKKNTFLEPVRKKIMEMKPRVYREVGRECRPETILSGQQIMCPESHPYPYGNLGTKFLRDCCHVDKDASGNPLQIGSSSCDQQKSVECTEQDGVQKWLHRSCCIYNSDFSHLKMHIGVPSTG